MAAKTSPTTESDTIEEVPNIVEPVHIGRVLGLDNNAAHLERLTTYCGRGQYLIESVRNSMQAGATVIRVDVLMALTEMQGESRYKMLVMDNGRGIPHEHMERLLMNLAGSGGEIGITFNFGQGLKVTHYPWNPRGVLCLTWQEGVGQMVRAARGKGGFGLHCWELSGVEMPESLHRAPADERLHPAWIKEHGTVLMLQGRTPEHATFFGPDESQGVWGNLMLLNERFFDLPESLDLKVRVIEKASGADQTNWPQDLEGEGTSLRRVRGARYYIEKTAKARGTMRLTKCTVHWWLDRHEDPKAKAKGGHSYARLPGYVGVLVENEILDATYPGDEARIYRLGRCGLIHPQVYNRVTMLFEPDKYDEQTGLGVRFSDQREKPVWGREGKSLPWNEWGQQFADKMPPEIAKLVKDATKHSTSMDLTDSLEPLIEQWDEWFKTYRLDKTGEVLDVVSCEGGTKRRLGIPLGEVADPPHPTGGKGGTAGEEYQTPGEGEVEQEARRVVVVQTRRNDIPKIEWSNDSGLEAAAGKKARGAVGAFEGEIGHYLSTSKVNTLTMNRDHFAVVDWVKRFCDRVIPGHHSLVVEAVHKAVALAVAAPLAFLRRRRRLGRGSFRLLEDEWAALTSNKALTGYAADPFLYQAIYERLRRKVRFIGEIESPEDSKNDEIAPQ